MPLTTKGAMGVELGPCEPCLSEKRSFGYPLLEDTTTNRRTRTGDLNTSQPDRHSPTKTKSVLPILELVLRAAMTAMVFLLLQIQALFQFQLSLAQPPNKLGHGRGSGESDLCDASISGDDRVELRAFGCKSGNDQLGVRDGEGHRLGTFRSYHRRVRQIKAGVGTLYWVAAFRYTALRCRQPYAVEQQSLEACHL
ncbi:hypothetical protein TSUD_291850 [Trifolium subterraneum]|uniref:Uncharacterized protein n=1 Tax=Trifolium subterraneum TaxID=3900 RepID=A0A2Z6PNR6_TRISU|nr:hypothetical protein TSUD_291850 [Trifolium subterraneum]